METQMCLKLYLCTPWLNLGIFNFGMRPFSELRMSRVHRVHAGFAPGWKKQRVLLWDGRVVEHGHSLDAQQHGQTPRNHVVEDDGAGGGGEWGGRETSHET